MHFIGRGKNAFYSTYKIKRLSKQCCDMICSCFQNIVLERSKVGARRWVREEAFGAMA
jgi:hypothetical protein